MMEDPVKELKVVEIVPQCTGDKVDGWLIFYDDGSAKSLILDKPKMLQAEIIKDVKDYERRVVWQISWARDIMDWDWR